MKKYLASLLRRIPGIEIQNIQESVELALLYGTHRNRNLHPSIIHFSFNKAATQYVKSILVAAATENEMVHAGINEYAFNRDFPFLDHLSAVEMKKYSHMFKNKGYLYSVFGGMIEGIPDLENYKIVFGVRDPRDILVSSYFSQAFSHPIPDQNGNKYDEFMKRRKHAIESGIDRYVLAESTKIRDIFDRYENLLLNRYSNIYITKYETMTVSFDSWLDDLLCYCDLNVSNRLRNKFTENNKKLKPADEDINKHVRKAQPGEYEDKLQPDTIQQLNFTFKHILRRFGY